MVKAYRIHVRVRSLKHLPGYESYDCIIRDAMRSYVQSSILDNYHWKILEQPEGFLIFILHFNGGSGVIDTILKDLNRILNSRDLAIYRPHAREISFEEYLALEEVYRNNGYEECSSAWSNEQGRADYLWELYSDKDA